jgi:polyhydroxybutyrate depolymerase
MTRLACIFMAVLLAVSTAGARDRDHPVRDWLKSRQKPAADRSVSIVFPAKGTLSSATRVTMMHDGLKRIYLAQMPAGQGPFPIILLLHGGTQSAENVWSQTSLPTLAARDKYILLAPDGVNNQWNDGRGMTMSGKQSSADDVGFLRALIVKTVKENNGDATRVFVTGGSNGGEMTYRLLCDASDMVAAAAPFIATMPVSLAQTCKPAKPVKMLMTFGTEDPLMNFDGGTINKKGNKTVPMLSADASVNFWARVNGCQSTTTQFQMPDLDPADGTIVQRTIYSSCTSGQTVGKIVVVGGGHSFPNGPTGKWYVKKIIGPTTHDIDAGDEIMKFFSNRAQ